LHSLWILSACATNVAEYQQERFVLQWIEFCCTLVHRNLAAQPSQVFAAEIRRAINFCEMRQWRVEGCCAEAEHPETFTEVAASSHIKQWWWFAYLCCFIDARLGQTSIEVAISNSASEHQFGQECVEIFGA
jgi:hypothetical protein